MKTRLATAAAALLFSSALAAPASAGVITSAVGTYYAFPTVNYFGAGPQTVAANIEW